MHHIIFFALLEALLISLLLLFFPILSCSDFTRSSKTLDPILPISQSLQAQEKIVLLTNLTTADAILSYSKKAQQFATTPPLGFTFLDEIEQHILRLTNEERKKHKLKMLKHDPMLQTSARTHSIDMIERNFFEHVNPDGKAPHDRMAIIHRQLIGFTGENLWQSKRYGIDDAQKIAVLAVKFWMKSLGHRENMLSKEYTHLGVGGTFAGETIKLTQNFASVQSLFQDAIPLEIKSGDHLPLATLAGAQKIQPEKYGLWLAEHGKLVADPVLMSQTQINVAPGDYRLHLYFVISRKNNKIHYLIYDGPHLVVK